MTAHWLATVIPFVAIAGSLLAGSYIVARCIDSVIDALSPSWYCRHCGGRYSRNARQYHTHGTP